MSDAEPAPVPQFYGIELFEHYEPSGSLLVVTSDQSDIRLEPGDFIVKRMWSTAVVPYIHNRAAIGTKDGDGDE